MAEHTALDSRVHQGILERVIATGHAPETAELARALACSVEEIEAALRRLHENHGLVLHPGSTRVWVIHPFALWPTSYWVTSKRGEWWGNCAWCSLGIAALLGEDTTIATSVGAHAEPIEILVRDGEVVEPELLVHFPLPVSRAWENVLFYCGTVLVFRSEAEIESWCARHGIARGAIVPIGQVWDLAREWYGRHLAPDWRKWSAREAQAIFERAGLRGEFWRVAGGEERF